MPFAATFRPALSGLRRLNRRTTGRARFAIRHRPMHPAGVIDLRRPARLPHAPVCFYPVRQALLRLVPVRDRGLIAPSASGTASPACGGQTCRPACSPASPRRSWSRTQGCDPAAAPAQKPGDHFTCAFERSACQTKPRQKTEGAKPKAGQADEGHSPALAIVSTLRKSCFTYPTKAN